MGVYSKIDIDLRNGDNPFEEDDAPECAEHPTIPAFARVAPLDPAAAPSVVEPVVSHQQNVEDTNPEEINTSSAEIQDDTDEADEAATETVSEDNKKKAHEEAEAKRKAEFEARQAAKKAAEQEQLDRLATMSDEDVLAVSMNRVSTDTEKLTRRNMKECVAEYIQTMCIEDPAFARRVMHPRKSMIHCIWYINRKAKEFVEQEMKDNGIKPENGIYGSDVPDDLCYQWAVDYFNDPDAEEDHKDEEKFVPKPYYGSTTSKSKGKSKGKSKEKTKKDPPKKAAPKPAPQSTSNEQMSLLGVA